MSLEDSPEASPSSAPPTPSSAGAESEAEAEVAPSSPEAEPEPSAESGAQSEAETEGDSTSRAEFEASAESGAQSEAEAEVGSNAEAESEPSAESDAPSKDTEADVELFKSQTDPADNQGAFTVSLVTRFLDSPHRILYEDGELRARPDVAAVAPERGWKTRFRTWRSKQLPTTKRFERGARNAAAGNDV
jgi:hypothetical protein